jgi:hypothetical protein
MLSSTFVTNSRYGLDAMAQLYRDRADVENGFNELKNQWGWGGFTTRDLERCQTSARAVALTTGGVGTVGPPMSTIM